MNITDKLNRWAVLAKEIQQLEKEIEEYTLTVELPQSTEEVEVAITSRGSYDYESIAYKVEPDEIVIKKYTKTVVDWKKVCDHVGVPAAVKEAFFTPGEKHVKIKLIKA